MDKKNEVYEKNLEYFMLLASDRAKIVEKLGEVDASDIIIENGNLAVNVNNRIWCLNSLYDSKECARIYADKYANEKRETIFIVFGFGNGEYIRALMNCKKDNIIVVYEPNPAILKKVFETLDVSDIVSNEKIFIAVGDIAEKYLREYFIVFINYANIKLNVMTSLPNYNIIYKEEYVRFANVYKDVAASEVFTRNTFMTMGEALAKNTLKTLPDALNQYSICQLKDAFKDVDYDKIPAILVSAGPSLDKNVELLEKAKGKAFIIVVDTALKTILRRGIVPDITITIDPKKPIVLFEHEKFENLPMIVGINSNPMVYEIHKGKRFYYCEKDAYLESVYKTYEKEIVSLETGGSVANDAFSFLKYMGFKNIILIGQDLAYPNNQGHSKEAYDGKEEIKDGSKSKKYMYVKDIYGEEVLTEYNMNMYKKWFESQIVRYEYLNVIDATEGGALIEGTKIMTFDEAISTYCTCEYAFEEKISAIIPSFEEEQVCEAKKKMIEMPKTLEGYKERLKDGIKDYNRLISLAAKQKWTSSEYRKMVKKIGETGKWIEEEPIFELVAKYTFEAEYDVLGNVNEYSEETSQYTQIREASEYGIKMLEAYCDGIDKLSEDWKALLENI